MNLISTLRAAGLRFSLRQDGKVGVTGFTAANESIKAQLPSVNAELVAVLQYEAKHGIPVENMGLYCWLSSCYDRWYWTAECPERTAALALLMKWNNALTDNFEAGRSLILFEHSKLAPLAANRALEGHALHAAVSGLANAPVVDAGAFGAPAGGAVLDLGVLA